MNAHVPVNGQEYTFCVKVKGQPQESSQVLCCFCFLKSGSLSWLGACQFGVCPFGAYQFGVCQFGSRLLGQGASYWGYERAPPRLAFYTWILRIEFRFSC